jgi:CYTH domain-containing protein
MSHTSKYAHIERERRFLLAVPAGELGALPFREIEDLYVVGTRLRLRRICAEGSFEHKLTQKVLVDATRCSITNTYLNVHEYEMLTSLPGRKLALRKRRYRYPGDAGAWSIDAFHDRLGGLILGEIEAATDAALAAIGPPPFRYLEVTERAEFRGDYLAEADPAQVLELAWRLLPPGPHGPMPAGR